MSDVKISALTSLAVVDIVTSTDVLPIVDTSAVETKKATVEAIVNAGLKAPGAVGGTTPAAITGTNVLATALLGYTTGAGGTVTQNTSITNTVTINKACGRIITYNETAPVTAFTSTLFSVVNSLTGTIFAVNDISGIPSISVADTGTVQIAPYSGNVLVGYTASNGNYKLQIGRAHV